MASPYRYISGQGPVREKTRIGPLTAGFMVGFALLFDAIQFFLSLLATIDAIGWGIIALAWFVSCLAFIIFGLWFFICGINYFTGKQAALRLLSVFSAVVLELMPLVMNLPAVTAGVIAVIVTSRIEDLAGKGATLQNLSPARKAALAQGVLQGRHVQDGQADALVIRKMYERAAKFSEDAGRMRVDGITKDAPAKRRYGQRGQNEALSFSRGQTLSENTPE